MRYYIVNDAAEVMTPTELDNGFYVAEVDASGFYVIADDAPYSPNEIMNAADYTKFSVGDIRELWMADLDQVSEPTLKQVAASHDVDLDELLHKHAERLQHVYETRTAGGGSHTFIALLSAFLFELEGK